MTLAVAARRIDQTLLSWASATPEKRMVQRRAAREGALGTPATRCDSRATRHGRTLKTAASLASDHQAKITNDQLGRGANVSVGLATAK